MVAGSLKSTTQGLISQLNNTQKKATKSFAKLSSGSRITSAADDAAGLAVVSALQANVAVLNQGARNISDGASIINIADSALSNLSDIQVRQAELAQQASNGTLSDDQRSTLNTEYQALEQEKSRILSSTSFNGKNVFESTTIQVGADGSADARVQIPGVDTSQVTNPALSIATKAGAQATLDGVQTQIAEVAEVRGQLGSSMSRLEKAYSNNQEMSLQSSAAASRINDADIASEVVNLVATKIQSKANLAVIASSNKLQSSMVNSLMQ